jgi:Antibiotic biosynthesis monooxygenase
MHGRYEHTRDGGRLPSASASAAGVDDPSGVAVVLARTSDGGRLAVKFVQTITWKTGRAEEMRAVAERFQAANPDPRPGFLGLKMLKDRDRENSYLVVAEFENYELAMQNSARPEVDAFSKEMMEAGPRSQPRGRRPLLVDYHRDRVRRPIRPSSATRLGVRRRALLLGRRTRNGFAHRGRPGHADQSPASA